jgi:hypothetical protein
MGMPLRVFSKFVVVLISFVIPLIQSPYLASQTVPPIGGRVVDAVTAKPIQGISLTLQISTYEGFSVHTEVKTVARSDPSGKFSLPGAKHPSGRVTLPGPNGTEIPFDEFRAYWLTVNEGFEANGQEMGSAEGQILFNPMLDPKFGLVTDKRYFPLTVTFPPLTIDPKQEVCGRVWAASCIHMDSWSGITIFLVPMLDDPTACNAIGESSLKERCRQLNTYHAAFLHRASYEDMKIGKRLCEDLGHGWIRDTCLDQLALHSGTPVTEALPVPDGMFPDSIAGLLVKNKHCGPRLRFSGRVMCGAAYGSETKELLATVQIEEFPEEETSNKPPPWNPSYTDHNEAKIREESLGDSKVLRYQGPQFNSFYWYSGKRHVEVFFYMPVPQQEQFVSYYLKRLPSNFQ